MAKEIYTYNRDFINIVYTFLEKFTWKPCYTAKDLAAQETAGKPMVGVCYDAVQYLAKKLGGSFSYSAYWVCGYGVKSILRWLACDSLHSFLLVKVGGHYFFADCFLAPMLISFDYRRKTCRVKGFTTEKEALEIMAKNIAGNDPYVIRKFNPLTVRMGNHIIYSLEGYLIYENE